MEKLKTGDAESVLIKERIYKGRCLPCLCVKEEPVDVRVVSIRTMCADGELRDMKVPFCLDCIEKLKTVLVAINKEEPNG